MSRLEELEKKIDKLEDTRMAYLEVNNKASARRLKKQIEMLELEIEVMAYKNVKKELKIYKDVIKEYPEIQNIVREKLEVQCYG